MWQRRNIYYLVFWGFQVNGVVLHGRCHLNASAIIKGLSGPIFKIIILRSVLFFSFFFTFSLALVFCLRRDSAVEDLAVQPVTQFPVILEDEVSSKLKPLVVFP